MSLPRKYGVFLVKQDFIEENLEEFIKQVMSKVLIVRCELDYMAQSFRYDAYCENFRELEVGEAPPRYDLLKMKNGDNTELEFHERIDFRNRDCIYIEDDNVSVLNLSVRTYNCLLRSDIATIGDLISKRQGYIKGLGDKGEKEIEEKLKKFEFIK